MKPIRLLLVDDHRIVRQGIRSLLELEHDLEVVAEADNGERALELIDVFQPDVVLLDIKMADMSGVEVCRQLTLKCPDIRVIILTAFSNDENVLQCIQAGAKGYVLKDVDVAELVNIIRAVCRGEAVLDPKITAVVMGRLSGTPGRQEKFLPSLTSQEITIIKLVSQGLTNQEIGERLFLSQDTVKYHLRNAMQKLEARNRAEAVYKAWSAGWLRH